MNLHQICNARLQKTDCFGNTIKFPRLVKNKYYLVANKVVKYLGIESDLAKFQCLNFDILRMTRRQMRGVYIEKLGDLENIYTDYEGKSIDKFSNGKTLSQVLDEIETRKNFI